MLDTRERNRISSVADAQQNARRHAQEVAAKTNAEHVPSPIEKCGCW
jgi:hypothetical protein